MNPVLKRILTALSIAALVVTAILTAPECAFLPVVLILFVTAVLEYVVLLNRKIPFSRVAAYPAFLAGVLVLGAALFSLLAILHTAPGDIGPNKMLLYVVMIVKCSDIGGFVFGLSSAKLMKGGNHKLCPSISPGKSWEGLLGSIIFSCVFSCAFMPITGFAVAQALKLGVVAALVGTAGDLVESKFKRWVGVKDSSAFKFTNGMGGILDMLDSLLFAPTVLWLLMGCFR